MWVEVTAANRDFVRKCFPDPAVWKVWLHGGVLMFRRGRPLHSPTFVTHGTPLSNVYEIVRHGIKVGPGTDTKVRIEVGNPGTGIFCIAGGDFASRVAQARKKSRSTACKEFYQFGEVSGWTTPCVLAWEPWDKVRKVSLKTYPNRTMKSCFPMDEGVVRQMPYNSCVFIRFSDLVNYIAIHNLPNPSQYMFCGGKTNDPLYWSTNHGMAPTCGCHVAIEDLPTSGWQLTKKAKVWFCPSCRQNDHEVQFWSEAPPAPPPSCEIDKIHV